MAMTVGQFNDSFAPVMDGVANVTYNYAYWLNKKYGQAYVITPGYPGHHDEEEFCILRYPSLPLPPRPPYRLGIPQLGFAMKQQLAQIPFDIIHAHSPFGSGTVALKMARQRNLPLVATFHSKYYDDFKAVVKSDTIARFAVRLVINFFNSVDQVWTINQSSVQTLREYGFTGPVEVVRNGTDFKPVANPDEALSLANLYLQIAPTDLVFLFVGQHIWHKNLRLLVESLQTVKQSNVPFKMVFVGTGSAADGLKQLVQHLGLEKQVQFTGLITDRELLRSLFYRANLFLFPSLYDTGGIVVQEAAAMQCPSIVIANSNAAEQIVDNYNGFLAENDPVRFGERILDAISDRARLKTVSKYAAASICQSWETIIDEVAGRYAELIRYKKSRTS